MMRLRLLLVTVDRRGTAPSLRWIHGDMYLYVREAAPDPPRGASPEKSVMVMKSSQIR